MHRIIILFIIFVVPVFTVAQDPFHDRLVYQLPAMSKVKIKPNIAFDKVNDTALHVDVYYPPGYSKEKLPVVIFNNGVGIFDMPRWGQYSEWCRLIAASGMIAVTHEGLPGRQLETGEHLIDYLYDHADELGIDKNRIALWTCSANARAGMRIAIKLKPDKIKALVVYYGGPDSLGQLRQNLPTLVVRAGLDAQFLNMGIENFIQNSLVQDTRLETINFLNGCHAFDLFTNTDESREVIKKTIRFLKDNLSGKPVPDPFVLTNRNFVWLIMNGMAETAFAEFRKVRDRDRADSTFNPFFNAVIREDVLNANAYWLLNHQKQNEALETFKLMVETYPASANAYDGLSDAYEILGNKGEALRNAEMVLQKLPGDASIRDDQFKERIRQSAEDKIRRLKN